jgi:quercetin dioxygenase-like cupin family protein
MHAARTILTGCALAFAAIAPLAAQTVKPGQKVPLLQSDHGWTGSAYTAYPKGRPQLTMIKLIVAPHSALPWHTHPQPNTGYILSGALTLQDRATGKTTTVRAGQVFAETVDQVHRGVNESDVPTVVLLTYAGVVGVPTTVPAKGEQSEY